MEVVTASNGVHTVASLTIKFLFFSRHPHISISDAVSHVSKIKKNILKKEGKSIQLQAQGHKLPAFPFLHFSFHHMAHAASKLTMSLL